jgi:hypothetical protein
MVSQFFLLEISCGKVCGIQAGNVMVLSGELFPQ